MRICPKCGFSNSEDFAICAWCNTSLAHAESFPHPDPANPDHEKRRQQHNRGRLLRRQLAEAVTLYSLVITYFTLSGLCFTWAPMMLLCSLATGIVTGIAVARGWAGQLTAPILQSGLGMAVAVYFGYVTPIMFFTLAGYAFAAVLLFIWVDHIRDAHR